MDALTVSSQNTIEEIAQPVAANQPTITDNCNMDVETLLEDRPATPQHSTLIDQLSNLTTFNSARKTAFKASNSF